MSEGSRFVMSPGIGTSLVTKWHEMARNGTNVRLHDELGQGLSRIRGDSGVKYHSGQLYALYWSLSGIMQLAVWIWIGGGCLHIRYARSSLLLL